MPRQRKISQSGVVDRIEHVDPESLSVPVVILLMQDEKIELYAAERGFGGLEEYAGVLQNMYNGPSKALSPPALLSIMRAVARRITEDPVSYRGYCWLRALYPSGLLDYAENHLPPG